MNIPSLPKKPKHIRNVYLDYAAATPLDSQVFSAMEPFLKDSFANPSSLYVAGQKAKKAIEDTRNQIANILHTQKDTIIFTSGATESCNLAIRGVASQKKGHIITTSIEHHAVLESINELQKAGFTITYIQPDENGVVNVSAIEKAIRKDTVLISVMYANNEIGSIQPIADIGRMILRWRKKNNTAYPYFHTDASQIPGNATLDVEKLHIDLLTASGAKIYGPKGVGILYKRRGIALQPLMFGGSQEFGYRSGTENTPAIIGFGTALEKIVKEQEKTVQQLAQLRDYFWQCIQKHIPDCAINGPGLGNTTERLVNNLHIHFSGIHAEALLLYLDAYGISVGIGSACTTDNTNPSHVLLAIGKTQKEATSSVRFTLGKHTTKKDIDYVMKYLPDLVRSLRHINTVSVL